MRIVSGQDFKGAFASVAEALAAAGQHDVPCPTLPGPSGGQQVRPARPALAEQREQDRSRRLRRIWTAIPARASAQPDLAPTTADRVAHTQALRVSR